MFSWLKGIVCLGRSHLVVDFHQIMQSVINLIFLPIYVASTKCIDPWVLEFVISNTTGNSQSENCILLDFNFHSYS
jgi:hypothetical protein